MIEAPKPKKHSALKRCPYCKVALIMSIEVTNKCCWDCHYEGKDKVKEENKLECKPKI